MLRAINFTTERSDEVTIYIDDKPVWTTMVWRLQQLNFSTNGYQIPMGSKISATTKNNTRFVVDMMLEIFDTDIWDTFNKLELK